MKRLIYYFLVISCTFSAILFSFNYYYLNVKKNKSKSELVLLKVEKGTTGFELLNILKNKGIIDNITPYKFLIKINLVSLRPISGSFKIPTGISIGDIFDYIGNSNNYYYEKITIPEGTRNRDLIKILRSKTNIVIPDSLIESDLVEGEYFPSTYNYIENSSYIEILKLAKIKNDEVWNDLWEGRDKSIPIKTIKEAKILASIVQAEAGYRDDPKDIAGVFYNRIITGMMLQSDPTVSYTLSDGVKLSRPAFKIKTDYNTYQIYGLPIGAINNPGIDSIKAVLHPTKTGAFYFVADNKGKSLFTKNFRNHANLVNRIRSKRYDKKDEEKYNAKKIKRDKSLELKYQNMK